MAAHSRRLTHPPTRAKTGIQPFAGSADDRGPPVEERTVSHR